MATCPNCLCKIGKGTANKRRLQNNTFIHKRCPGTPKRILKKVKTAVKKNNYTPFRH